MPTAAAALHERERADLLPHVVFEDFEVVGLQVEHGPALAIAHDDVHEHGRGARGVRRVLALIGRLLGAGRAPAGRSSTASGRTPNLGNAVIALLQAGPERSPGRARRASARGLPDDSKRRRVADAGRSLVHRHPQLIRAG